MKKALILAGWKQPVTSNFYPWLKKTLEEKGYEVFLPELPTMESDSPKMNPQIEFLEELAGNEEVDIIVGHSLGTILAMRFAEKYKFKKMFLIAGWDFNDLTVELQNYWVNPLNHQKIRENVKEIYCISSDNDPFMTAFTVEQMSKRLNGKFILVKGAGHFITDDGVDKITDIEKYL